MKNLIAIALVLSLGGGGPAQEKEFVLDTTTGVVSQKDKVQDAEIGALKAKVAELEKLVKLTQTMKELEAAATSGTYPTAAQIPAPAAKADPNPAPCRDCGCAAAVAKKAAPVAAAVPAPAGGSHAHTCPRCGTTWSHTGGPGDNSHNCPKCGTFQNVVSGFAPAAAPVYSIVGFGSAGGGCAGGSCAAPARFTIFRRR